MEKTIILILMLLIISCSKSPTFSEKQEQVEIFYKKNKNTDFEIFKCYCILQWNQNRVNTKKEYHIEFYPNCEDSTKVLRKPLRGTVKFRNNKPPDISFYSTRLESEDLMPILESFYILKISNLIYKDPNKLWITIHPKIRLVRTKKREEGYSSLDSSWHYMIY